MNGTNEADDMNSPPTPGGLARLAGWCYDHRRRVLTGWILVVLVVIALSGVVGSAFSNNFNSGNSPSQRAQDLLAQRFPAQAGDTADVVIHTTGQVNDAANAGHHQSPGRRLGAAPECHERAEPSVIGRGTPGVGRRAHRLRRRPVRQDHP